MNNITPSIILVHPQLAENVGMAARAMMNCNLSDMRLVSPREDHLSAKAISASSGAEEILHQAKVFDSVQEAIADLQDVYATTARHRNQTKMVYTADKAATEMTKAIKQGLCAMRLSIFRLTPSTVRLICPKPYSWSVMSFTNNKSMP